MLTNTSPISAQFIFKSSKNSKLTFDSAVYKADADTNVNLKVGHPVVTSKGNKINVDTPNMVLEPHQECTVTVTLDCITVETVHEEIEILVEDSQSLFIQMHGEI